MLLDYHQNYRLNKLDSNKESLCWWGLVARLSPIHPSTSTREAERRPRTYTDWACPAATRNRLCHEFWKSMADYCVSSLYIPPLTKHCCRTRYANGCTLKPQLSTSWFGVATRNRWRHVYLEVCGWLLCCSSVCIPLLTKPCWWTRCANGCILKPQPSTSWFGAATRNRWRHEFWKSVADFCVLKKSIHSSADKALLMDALRERLYSENAIIYKLILDSETLQQNRIGWQQVFNGRFCQRWSELQDDTIGSAQGYILRKIRPQVATLQV
jgi:hypothetical protein